MFQWQFIKMGKLMELKKEYIVLYLFNVKVIGNMKLIKMLNYQNLQNKRSKLLFKSYLQKNRQLWMQLNQNYDLLI